jgi:hypothetical protein
MLEYIPGIGLWLQELIQGGAEVGPGTLSNFYAIHTAILPASLLILMPFHFWRIRKVGGLVIPRKPEQSSEDRGRSVPAIPNLLLRETAKQGLDPNVWFNNVEMVAAKRIGRETVQYVSNIYKYYIAYKLITEVEEERAKAMGGFKAQ